jgi:prolipoprotein diacylglyceryltransferase
MDTLLQLLLRPGVIPLIGAWIGLSIAEKFSARRGVHPETLYNLVFAALIAGAIGARLTFAIQNPSAFVNPVDLISLNPGLLDPIGGLAFACAAALVYGRRKKLPFRETLDALTPALAVWMISLAISSDAFGSQTDIPWAVDTLGAQRHPSQVYELIGSTLILGMLWRSFVDAKPQAGLIFLRFAALTAGARLFLEAFRGDSIIVFGSLRQAQIVAWVVLAVSCAFIDKFSRKAESRPAQ